MPPDIASQINAELSRRLAQERVARGISKKKLAGLAGMDRTTVSFIEDPEKNPTIYNLIRYALALEIDLGVLLSECVAEQGNREPKRR
ncbi:helix-turn-helix domain-containing protein [Verrucomicrobium spinosum]|uniref:helix-turn-helix domain-containing protein n=1 Tax=Verrucomicrobium spinosum TaxID=2736 RepID=UPI000174685B